METGKKMNICAGGATGLSGGRVTLLGERSAVWAEVWAAGVAGPGPKETKEPSPCLVLVYVHHSSDSHHIEQLFCGVVGEIDAAV